jgi:hypothetical protein
MAWVHAEHAAMLQTHCKHAAAKATHQAAPQSTTSPCAVAGVQITCQDAWQLAADDSGSNTAHTASHQPRVLELLLQ